MTRPRPFVGAVLRWSARLVPRYRRTEWRRQWEAEIAYLDRHADGARTLRVAMGAIRHAWATRVEEMTMRGWSAGVRTTMRGVLRRPGFSALAVATLAVGIGTATAIFSLGEAMVLRAVPYPDGERLVGMFSANARTGFSSFAVSYPDFEDVVLESGLFDAGSFYLEVDQDIAGGAEPQRVRVARVHREYFQTLRARFTLGRAFGDDDHEAASEPTVVIDERLWRSRFGADSTLLGQSIRVDGFPHTVVGVLEAGQGWPSRATVWTPLQWGSSVPEYAAERSNHTWQVIGRLREGPSVGEASGQVREMARAIYAGEDIDERDIGTEAFLLSLRTSAGGESATPIFLTLGVAVTLVLLIACMNAGGLLLTRALGRARELSLRAALGAGRVRLVGTLMAETMVLALLGGTAGVGLGHVALRSALAAAPPEVAAAADVQLNPTVLGAALAVSLVAALGAGLLPALRATRGALAESLKDGSGGAGTGRGTMRVRQFLVTSEIAFSVALLVVAGMTVRGFQRQLSSDPGFAADPIASFTLKLPAARFESAATIDGFLDRAVEELQRSPLIEDVATISRLPLGGAGASLFRSFVEDGMPEPPDGVEYGALWIEVDPGTFRTLGASPIEGRDVTRDDGPDSPPVAVVNERMARRMAPDGTLVGRRIRSFYDENVNRTVVGVVPDLQFNGVSRAQRQPIVFVPREQAARREMAFLVRAVDAPDQLLPEIRRIMTGLDGDIALSDLQTLRDSHAADLAGIRFFTSLFGAFGVLALILAVSGVYGLVSYSVSLRTREVGLRMAIGATATDVRVGVLRESAGVALLGLGVGTGLAWAGGRVIAAGLDGIALMQATTFVGVLTVLGLAVLAATWVPAGRATRVDPMTALRSE
ncbi:MAG: ADOP family duplicated permease [Gemmatimonadota bacterium]